MKLSLEYRIGAPRYSKWWIDFDVVPPWNVPSRLLTVPQLVIVIVIVAVVVAVVVGGGGSR
jgi:hypothetical protein